jgi:transposase
MSQKSPGDVRRGKFVSLLLAGKSVGAAAKELNITRPTAYRWFNLPETQKELTDGNDIGIRMSLVILARAATRAALVLVEIMNRKRPKPGDWQRMHAANKILERTYEVDFDERLRKVERANEKGDSW